VSLIDELVRQGARKMPAEALQTEVDDYIARFAPSARTGVACVAILRPAHAVCGRLPYELDPDILLLRADHAAHVIMSSERASSQ
jgi:hypothetical protein